MFSAGISEEFCPFGEKGSKIQFCLEEEELHSFLKGGIDFFRGDGVPLKHPDD
jgi:hypothetical protein